MFALCDGMRWTHLPNAGGLYNQHPDLLEKFRIIFSERNKEQAKRQKEQETKSRRPQSRVAGRR